MVLIRVGRIGGKELGAAVDLVADGGHMVLVAATAQEAQDLAAGPVARQQALHMALDPGVASPIICRSALAIEAHRGVASLANTLGIGCAMRLALRSDGCAQPTTSDP